MVVGIDLHAHVLAREWRAGSEEGALDRLARLAGEIADVQEDRTVLAACRVEDVGTPGRAGRSRKEARRRRSGDRGAARTSGATRAAAPGITRRILHRWFHAPEK
jgi:hypothetical protein